MSGARIIAGLEQTVEMIALQRALDDYDKATLGSLNVTAEALRAAASACGWTWNSERGSVAWSRDFLARAKTVHVR